MDRSTYGEVATVAESAAEVSSAPSAAGPPRSWSRWAKAAVASIAVLAAASLAHRAFRASLRSVAVDGLEGKNAVEWAYTWPKAPREKCGKVEDNTEYLVKHFMTVGDIRSASMCCSACSGHPRCGAWSWGKNFGVPGVGQVCFLKELTKGKTPPKKKSQDFMSGLPHPEVVKYGITPAPASKTHKMDGVEAKDVEDDGSASPSCPGKLRVEGYKDVTLVNTKGSKVEILKNDAVVSHIRARSYWAGWCKEGVYSNDMYDAINPLGKTIRYTVDVSGTGCGCNAAFYFTTMKYNTQVGNCGDYYCDVMSVCGVACLEIDLQEANQYAWRSTFHAPNDFMGKARGYGGSQASPSRRDWTSAEYSPGGKCVDTTKPFQVAFSFPVDHAGNLRAFEVHLSQHGKPCTLNASITSYVWGWPPPRKNDWGTITKALRAGVTPVMSYWKSDGMLWMDGLGEDGRGPCVLDNAGACPEYVRFYNFSVTDYKEAAATATKRAHRAKASRRHAGRAAEEPEVKVAPRKAIQLMHTTSSTTTTSDGAALLLEASDRAAAPSTGSAALLCTGAALLACVAAAACVLRRPALASQIEARFLERKRAGKLQTPRESAGDPLVPILA